MIQINLGDISIRNIGQSSGFFIGEKNSHKKFRSKVITNEVTGLMSGNENRVMDSYWIKNKQKGEDD
ncbi:hypothetical protein ACF5W4_09795 [Bacillota bacterium Lsc_1132]